MSIIPDVGEEAVGNEKFKDFFGYIQVQGQARLHVTLPQGRGRGGGGGRREKKTS